MRCGASARGPLRRLVPAFALWILLPSGAQGQASDIDELTASAEVIQAIAVVGERDLDFGTVLGGAVVTIDPEDAAAGKFEVLAAPGSDVRIQFTQLPTELARVTGVETIPLQLGATIGSTDNPTAGTPVVLTGQGQISAFPASGILFVWIGGTITPATDQPTGSYEATIELTATYVAN